jgi:hypothetical protein
LVNLHIIQTWATCFIKDKVKINSWRQERQRHGKFRNKGSYQHFWCLSRRWSGSQVCTEQCPPVVQNPGEPLCRNKNSESPQILENLMKSDMMVEYCYYENVWSYRMNDKVNIAWCVCSCIKKFCHAVSEVCEFDKVLNITETSEWTFQSTRHFFKVISWMTWLKMEDCINFICISTSKMTRKTNVVWRNWLKIRKLKFSTFQINRYSTEHLINITVGVTHWKKTEENFRKGTTVD